MTLILALLKDYWVHCTVVLGACGLGFFLAWNLQGLKLDLLAVEYARYQAQVERQAAQAREALAAQERHWLEDQQHALVNARTRETQLKKDVAVARAAALGLRDDLAALRTRLAAYPGSTCIEPVAAIGDLLSQCSDAYRDLADVADRHVSDILTLREAWPQ